MLIEAACALADESCAAGRSGRGARCTALQLALFEQPARALGLVPAVERNLRLDGDGEKAQKRDEGAIFVPL